MRAEAASPAFGRTSRRLVGAIRRTPRPLVLIDGPSGSGKSTLADALVTAWAGKPPELVRLDDAYPGWTGLEQAPRNLARTLVQPWLRRMPGGYRRWDWGADAPGPAVSVVPGPALLVEGCGAFAVVEPAVPAVRIWVEAADDLRRRRALARDGGAYDPFWEIWDRQWRSHVRRSDPRAAATISVDGGSAPRTPGYVAVRRPDIRSSGAQSRLAG
ncbi:ATP-binding protein [Agromyces salentinus]|uniref:AAA family ATPase n=1 Tax=Agromyces salentinus TaxID=269421 RepID=A0ABN2MNU9_9MICO|nr:ATP-binding protein [Agromyces salentinus]